MVMYNYVICFVTNLFRTLIIARFIGVFFDQKRVEKKWEICTYVLFYIMTVSLYLVFHNPTINVISNILGMFIITLVYSDVLKKKIVVVILIYLVNMLCDSIAVLSFTNYIVGEELNEIVEVITFLLILISELIVEKIVDKKNRYALLPTHVTFLLLIPLSSIIMLYIMTMERFNHRSVLIYSSFGFLIINMTAFYLYNAIAESYSQKLERDLIEQKSKAYANQLDVIMQSQEKIRSLQHDMKHHMRELKNIAVKIENTNMIEYLDKMENFMANPIEHVYSGNKEIDSILNFMIQNAKKVLKEVNVQMCIPDNLVCHSFELNVILGNLLENAIEAAKQTEEKKLNIHLVLNRGILFIYIQNSFLKKFEINNNRIFTSKNERDKHGFGLKNVKRMVEIHNGTMSIYEKEDRFHVDVMLYMSNIK